MLMSRMVPVHLNLYLIRSLIKRTMSLIISPHAAFHFVVRIESL